MNANIFIATCGGCDGQVLIWPASPIVIDVNSTKNKSRTNANRTGLISG